MFQIVLLLPVFVHAHLNKTHFIYYRHVITVGQIRDQLKLNKNLVHALLNGKMYKNKHADYATAYCGYIFIENIMMLLLSLYVVVNGGVCFISWYCVGLCASIHLVKPF